MMILQMSISAGALIAFIAIVRALAIDKLPKTTFVILWGIAVCRLILPVSIPIPALPLWTVSDWIGSAASFLPSPAADISTLANGQSMEGVPGLAHSYAGGTATSDRSEFIAPIVVVWLAGTILLSVYCIAAFYRSYREIRTALPLRHHPFIEEWLRGHKTVRPIRILVSDRIATPIACGLLKPRIILPKALDLSDEGLLKQVLTHELTHIKHFDVVWKTVSALALCIHWFNPLVWLLYMLLNRDLELACDEKVLQKLGDDKKADYALSLIAVAERNSKFAPLYNGFGKNAVQERIVSIMKFRKASVATIVLSVALTLGAVSVFAAGTAEDMQATAVTVFTPGTADDVQATVGSNYTFAFEQGDGPGASDESLDVYTDYGIEYDPKTQRYLWDNKAIRLLIDGNAAAKRETDTLYFDARGAVDVQVIRNGSNQIEKIVSISDQELVKFIDTYGFHIAGGNIVFR
ncbi:hypothetical protein PAE9249_02902 [Paenibacillus sp. CECT 9249]|uniref:M56 family metallopeptidase n=1 Tax=Paenibacillus sp. CECT 9249 TaxID=2845385 RepID=UPI001E3C120F|nr:M56 family metallopeptidase [Paenibacillus sp. CECT 9249]CAH0120383.1 hypothetical protein PAE9249_02902 [Paenibacillus sp. CECT 9249]